MQIRTLWRRFIRLARRRLRRPTAARNLSGFSGRIILIIFQQPNTRKVQRGLSGSRMWIFDNPRKILGKTIRFEDRCRCRDCGWFESGDTCSPGIDCPTGTRTEKVDSITYSMTDVGMRYEINKGIVFTEERLAEVQINADADG